jgi:hypothetical protein
MRDYAQSIQQTSDGGFVVAGFTASFGAGLRDFWVLKLDASGSVAWQKTYGDANSDEAYAVQQTSDGGFTSWGTSRGRRPMAAAVGMELDRSNRPRTTVMSWRDSRHPSARAVMISGF